MRAVPGTGNTLLHYLCNLRETGRVREALGRDGARLVVDVRNGAGHTPLDYAVAWGDDGAVEALRTYYRQHLGLVHIQRQHRDHLQSNSRVARLSRGTLHVRASRRG